MVLSLGLPHLYKFLSIAYNKLFVVKDFEGPIGLTIHLF
jgi:hypothetical protein